MSKIDMEPTLQDVITAVNAGFTDVAQQFAKLENTVVTKEYLDQRLKQESAKLVTKEELKQELAAMETRLVTKAYLDDKLYDLRGDLNTLLRKEDHKVDILVNILEGHHVISAGDSQRVMEAGFSSRA